ncbi:MAG TPA: hypothetical protein VHV83_09795, partial [Armatimonadota bacterium]|nr:hypothetical protein [Armatimonadota bacterium]
MIFNGASGNYRLHDKPFAGGGEGDVYHIDGMPGFVAKLYTTGKRTPDRLRKLGAMVHIKPAIIDQYAWPTDILFENNQFAGFVMPEVSGKEKLRNIYVYDNRRGKPWALYVAIAKNLASAVHNVHEINQVIGDLNPENILVDPNTGIVTLIDCDSYHITDASGNVMRCGVGMPEFVAPELQGIHFPSEKLPTFIRETDRFSLSVLIFAMLMNGAHPYACKVISGSSSKFQSIDNMVHGICAYFGDSSNASIDIPRYAPDINSLPQDIQALFKRAFVDGHKVPGLRPTAEEWYNALDSLERNIKACIVNPEHQYYYYATECPWCKVEGKMRSVTQTTFNRPSTFTPSSAVQPTASSSMPGPSNFVLVPPNTLPPVQKHKLKPGAWVAMIVVALFLLFTGGIPVVNLIASALLRQSTPVSNPYQPAGALTDNEPTSTPVDTIGERLDGYAAVNEPISPEVTPSPTEPNNRQKITVVANGNRATVSLVEWRDSEGWVKLYETTGYLGRNGISEYKREGDGKTPAGTFDLGFVFGLSKPNTGLDIQPSTALVIKENASNIDNTLTRRPLGSS